MNCIIVYSQHPCVIFGIMEDLCNRNERLFLKSVSLKILFRCKVQLFDYYDSNTHIHLLYKLSKLELFFSWSLFKGVFVCFVFLVMILMLLRYFNHYFCFYDYCYYHFWCDYYLFHVAHARRIILMGVLYRSRCHVDSSKYWTKLVFSMILQMDMQSEIIVKADFVGPFVDWSGVEMWYSSL